MDQIGRYRIIGELGRGAMGVVYHATDPAIGRSVAIKTIRIRDINDTRHRDKLRERLFREARSAGVLSHPNIVTIYDMDEVDGLAYIAMAFVNGPSLEKILAGGGPISGAAMLRILRQTASALDYAHGRGIVHRDVKPANIMTDEDGAVKITDFGIAKLTASANTTDTRTVVGTPNYMSPEQVQGLEVDGKSDQFSLAVIAYEILTGERPFTGEHLSTIVFKIVSEEPSESFRINTTLSPHIDEALRRGLAKKPENRYPNCASFVGALEMACAESRGWKTLASGASGFMPTVGVERGSAEARSKVTSKVTVAAPPAVPVMPTLPILPILPAQPFRGDTADAPKKKRLFPVLMSLVIVLSAVAIITWQAGGIPGFGPSESSATGNSAPVAVPEAAPPQSAPAASEPSTPQGSINNTTAADATPAAPDSTEPAQAPALAEPETPPAAETPKPSPLGTRGTPPEIHETEPRETVRIPPARIPDTGSLSSRPPGSQDVWVTTNPPGAKIVLDNDLSQSCQSPCMLHSPQGVHHLTISDAGYQNEYREIHVGDTAQDMPLIALRQPSGTLMVTTVPAGAAIRINGRPIPQVTPAQITLAPGSYSVTVEKNGHTQTQRINMTESLLYLKIPLEQ